MDPLSPLLKALLYVLLPLVFVYFVALVALLVGSFWKRNSHQAEDDSRSDDGPSES
jgi:hypothetical protein